MRRNRIDFVPAGNAAGQIADIKPGFPRERKGFKDGVDDAGKFAAVEYTYTLPGDVAAITLWGHPFVYGVRAVAGEHGPQVVELDIRQPEHEPDVPITPDDLRKLARYLDRLAYAATAGIGLLASPAFHQPEKKRPGRRGHPDSFYAEIAKVAKQAHRDRYWTGVSVRASIAAQRHVSPEVANKWLARARQLGYLKAGELGGKPKPRKGVSK